jgi:hypothetical protein
MDQTNVFFESTLKTLTTIGKCGSQEVCISKQGDSKQATVNLTVRLDGTKLPVLTICAYKTNGLVAREEVPILNERHDQYNVFCCQMKGWCDHLTM